MRTISFILFLLLASTAGVLARDKNKLNTSQPPTDTVSKDKHIKDHGRSKFMHDDKCKHTIRVDWHGNVVTVLEKHTKPLDSIVKFDTILYRRSIFPIDSNVYKKDSVFETQLVHKVKYDYAKAAAKTTASFPIHLTINNKSYTDVVFNSSTSSSHLAQQTIKNYEAVCEHPLQESRRETGIHERIKIWEHYRLRKRAHLYLALNYMASYSREIVLIKSQDNSLTNTASARSNNEMGVYGSVLSPAIGITIGSANTLYVAYISSMQGFNALKHTVDLNSGMPTTTSNNHTYKLRSTGYGIGYSHITYYAGDRRRVHSVFDIGIYRQDIQSITDNGNKMSFQDQTLWSGKTGLGISIHPRYCIEFQIVPTVFWNFTNIGNQTLDTKLFNVGITGGIVFRPHIGNVIRCNQ